MPSPSPSLEELLTPAERHLPLLGREAHIWCLAPDAVDEPALVKACVALLSPDEQGRYARFRVAVARHEYLVAHALVRLVLSHYVDVDPRAWVFAPSEHGRPEIVAPPEGSPLRFNLSHTDGLIACAVALGTPIGVDVEHVGRAGDLVRIAERFFSPLEVAALHALETTAQHRRFLAFWTLKESYVKARGLGLSLPLDDFAFLLDDERAIGVRFGPRMADDPRMWRFALLAPTPAHVLALTLRNSAECEPLAIRMHGLAALPVPPRYSQVWHRFMPRVAGPLPSLTGGIRATLSEEQPVRALLSEPHRHGNGEHRKV